jgi:hypothetical protein
MHSCLNIYVIALSLVLFSCNNKETSISNENAIYATSANGEKIANGKMLSKTELSPLEYVTWMRDVEHGLYKEKTIDNLTYSAQYKTEDYVTCIEADDKANIQFKKTENEEGNFVHFFDFKIKIENHNGEILKYNLSSPLQYDNRVKYLSFEAEKDIYLVDGTDTIPCSIYHFERAYDVAPELTMILGFASKQKYISTKTLVFQDKIFDKGIIKFTIPANELANIPTIKTTI